MQAVCELERESTYDQYIQESLALPPACSCSKSSLSSLESSRATNNLNKNDWKQAIQIINKIVYQIVHKY
jgi:hypothetical protein